MGTLALLLILAVIQGLTEFLPVSSSGHLVLARELLPGGEKLSSDATVEVLLHIGTLLAVIVFYRREILQLALGLMGRGSDPLMQRKLFGFLVLGSLPAALIGLTLEKQIGEIFSHPAFAASAILVTGGVLFWSRRLPANGPDLRHLTMRLALVVGIAQAIAILPGISRSGATIVTGMAFGLSMAAAATFSFLLSIPAVLGAIVLKSGDIQANSDGLGLEMLAAVALSAAVGLSSLGLLVRLGRARRLWWFAPYCWLAGVVGLLGVMLTD